MCEAVDTHDAPVEDAHLHAPPQAQIGAQWVVSTRALATGASLRCIQPLLSYSAPLVSGPACLHQAPPPPPMQASRARWGFTSIRHPNGSVQCLPACQLPNGDDAEQQLSQMQYVCGALPPPCPPGLCFLRSEICRLPTMAKACAAPPSHIPPPPSPGGPLSRKLYQWTCLQAWLHRPVLRSRVEELNWPASAGAHEATPALQSNRCQTSPEAPKKLRGHPRRLCFSTVPH